MQQHCPRCVHCVCWLNSQCGSEFYMPVHLVLVIVEPQTLSLTRVSSLDKYACVIFKHMCSWHNVDVSPTRAFGVEGSLSGMHLWSSTEYVVQFLQAPLETLGVIMESFVDARMFWPKKLSPPDSIPFTLASSFLYEEMDSVPVWILYLPSAPMIQSCMIQTPSPPESLN